MLKHSSFNFFFFFQMQAKLELMTELDNKFKLNSFILLISSWLFTSYSEDPPFSVMM
jgi:hypothetical protein